ncbi:MAG: DNA polymerase IV [Bacteroidales bacterium]|nr:DNA polymerase IV [Bacteroidales bacterium]
MILNRCILHIDMDTFFVSVERLLNSSFNEKPVVVGGISERGVVASCSYEARKYGIHSGMPMKMARSLCNDAMFIRGDMEQYSKFSRMVTEIIAEKAPLYEKTSIDEHYLDLTGMDHFFGCMKWTKELRQVILKETGLPVSMGLSCNKTVSKIATGEAKPNGELEVKRNEAKSFLAPLSVRKIPGIGKKTYYLLATMGVNKIQTLSVIPLPVITNVLGKNGEDIWKKANGIDNTLVKPYSEHKSISTEQTFEQDTIDFKRLTEIIAVMSEKLAFELRNQQKITSCVTIKIRYSNFDTHTLQKCIPYTSFDHTIIEVAKELFKQLYNRRLLVRLVGVKFSHLVHGFQQLSLFDDRAKMAALYPVLDKLKNQYGSKIIRRAIAFH